MNEQPSEKEQDLAPDYLTKAYNAIKPDLEAIGKKFVLIVFDREEYIRAASKGGGYNVSAGASCGRAIVREVIKDFAIREGVKGLGEIQKFPMHVEQIDEGGLQ